MFNNATMTMPIVCPFHVLIGLGSRSRTGHEECEGADVPWASMENVTNTNASVRLILVFATMQKVRRLRM